MKFSHLKCLIGDIGELSRTLSIVVQSPHGDVVQAGLESRHLHVDVGDPPGGCEFCHKHLLLGNRLYEPSILTCAFDPFPPWWTP